MPPIHELVSPANARRIAATTVGLALSAASLLMTGCGEKDVALKPRVGPDATFSAEPTRGIGPLEVRFTDESTPGTSRIFSWAWTFGDGGTSSLANPEHVYANPGSYSVSLKVTTAVGADTETKEQYITVSEKPTPPTAAFSGSPRSGTPPLAVHFTDLSSPGSSDITAWSWSFGDGGTSTTQNPDHSYAGAGTYSVSLTVTTSAGSDTETKSGYITVSIRPTADFSGTPRSGTTPLTVQFTDQSTAGSSPITAWAWSFGDGGTSASQSPSHVYAAAGSYAVSLKVTTSAGEDTETKPAYVTASSPVPPTAQLSGAPTSGAAPLTVQFTDQSSPGTSPITSWLWSFGDGGSSASQNPSHEYASAGSYTVSLTVESSVGSDTDTKPGYVTVFVPPTAEFTGAPQSGTSPLTVQFEDESTPGSSAITAWSWSFGDGGASASQSPSHTYLSPGTYTVSLHVTTPVAEDSETKTGYIVVSEPPPVPPTAQFSGAPRSGPAPLSVQFTDASAAGSEPITAWLWSFGDGGSSPDQNPSHLYAGAGSYAVSLTVTTSAGQSTETKAAYIDVCAPPVADFSAAPTSGLAPLAVQFTDQSTGGDLGIDTWAWSFGDGGTSSERNPAHLYVLPGTYDVSLTVGNRCSVGTRTRTGYVTAQGPCDTPTYTIHDAFWEILDDSDQDGYAERSRLWWDADVSPACVKSVFARVYRRAPGESAWILTGESPCYTITGASTLDETRIQITNVPFGCYEFQILLFECSGASEKATLGPADDPDLVSRCLEPQGQ